ncbi:hypothetical protein D3C80_680130 [compost metagenome]
MAGRGRRERPCRLNAEHGAGTCTVGRQAAGDDQHRRGVVGLGQADGFGQVEDEDVALAQAALAENSKSGWATARLGEMEGEGH